MNKAEQHWPRKRPALFRGLSRSQLDTLAEKVSDATK